MSGDSKSNWYLVPLSLVSLIPVLPSLIGRRADMAAFLTQNRMAFEQVALVVAGAVTIAAIAAGIRAWRSAHA